MARYPILKGVASQLEPIRKGPSDKYNSMQPLLVGTRWLLGSPFSNFLSKPHEIDHESFFRVLQAAIKSL